MTTLIDGRDVASDSQEWREECLARHRHVEAMRGLQLDGRRDYIARVELTDGAVAAERLRLAYTRDWEARRDAE